MKGNRVHLRSIAVAILCAGVLSFVSTGSQAATAGVYKLRGALKATKSSWVLTGTMSLTSGVAGNTPKSATLSASGPLGKLCAGPQPEPPTRCVSTGVLKISWSNGTTSMGTVVYTRIGLLHLLLGRVAWGSGKALITGGCLGEIASSGSFEGRAEAAAPLD